MSWASSQQDTSSVSITPASSSALDAASHPQFVVQVVRQVNYGPLESKRYFAKANSDESFIEVTERDLIEANYQKLNS